LYLIFCDEDADFAEEIFTNLQNDPDQKLERTFNCCIPQKDWNPGDDKEAW
jgi:hypothetical protein